ncbi:MAG TPA: adhesin, partial [Archangium sp.]|nr:adhesin [Archangium sp.]
MKSWFQVALLALGLCSATALAGPDSFDVGSGRDGPLTVTAAGTVINRHARVTGPIAPGDNVLLVAGTEGFGAGDLVMVLQVTGMVPEPLPGLTGPVELSRDAVGRWELVRLAAVGEGALTVSSPLVHSYAAQVTQVIRVPEYTHVRIQRDASLRAVPWNGGTGGVVAFLATGSVHNEGEITATGAGFRGGRYVPDSSNPVACSSMDVGARPGAQKGEGVA